MYSFLDFEFFFRTSQSLLLKSYNVLDFERKFRFKEQVSEYFLPKTDIFAFLRFNNVSDSHLKNSQGVIFGEKLFEIVRVWIKI